MGDRPRESWGREGRGRATERVKRESRERMRSGGNMLLWVCGVYCVVLGSAGKKFQPLEIGKLIGDEI